MKLEGFNDSEITEDFKCKVAFWPISFSGWIEGEFLHEGY
jgi:hypothetical protein